MGLELQEGRNCWRVETARRLSLIIDGQDYFRALRESLLQARRLMLMIGWDVAIDDSPAFCGGIDVTAGRWDTPDHARDQPRRGHKDGEALPPWHDAAAVMDGPAAAAISELARQRWTRANNGPLDEATRPGADIWPDSVAPQFRDARLAIARTEPPDQDRPCIAGIEALYLDSIAAAKHIIYLESQYFCCYSIADAIAVRLAEQDGPEVVVINP